MEESDTQIVGQGIVLKASAPSATSASRLSLASAASLSSKPGSQSSSQVNGPSPARPRSAGISAWEDDSTQPGADLLAYLGKADSQRSDTSTPRHHGPISGDGNLAHALMQARKAAEMELEGRSSSGATAGDGLEQPSSQQSLGGGASSHGRASSGAGAGVGAGAGAGTRRRPGRLSRASGCDSSSNGPNGAPAAWQQRLSDPQAAGREGSAYGPGGARPGPGSRPSGSEEEFGEDEEEGSDWERQEQQQESTALGLEAEEEMVVEGNEGCLQHEDTEEAWSSAPAEKRAGGSGVRGERELRNLLLSDDEDGDDDDYQDLMTADDDALFGSLDGGSGRGGGNGGGRRAAAQSQPAALSPASSIGAPEVSADDATAASGGTRASNEEHLSYSSSAAASAEGAAGGPSSRESSFRRSGCGVGSSGNGGGVGSPRQHAPLPARAATLPSFPSASLGAPSEGAPAPEGSCRESSEACLDAAAPGRGSCVGLAAAAHPFEENGGEAHAPTAHLQLQSQRQQQQGTHHTHVHMQEQQVIVMVQQAQQRLQPSQGNPQFQFQQGQQAQAGLHQPAQPHYSIPTAQVGEGLRQHPPARRLYTPGQTNRSPVRGSGYVVSPAAVRPMSPQASMGRVYHGGLHHHGHSAPAGKARRSSSASLTAATLTTARPARHRSPRESHASAGSSGGASAQPDGEAGAGEINAGAVTFGALGTGAAPQHHGMVLVGQAAGSGSNSSSKVGTWTGPVLGSGAGGAAGGAPHGSRFPAAVVQLFAGGQVYRSTPISQVTGSTDEGFGGVASAGAAGVRGSGSPGRMSSRGTRQPRAGPGAGVPHMARYGSSDRYGSNSAPARPSTSPVRSSHGVIGSPRPATRSTGMGGLGPTSATTVFGNGVLTGPVGDSDGLAMSAAQAAIPRSLAVPSMPQYGMAAGIRHCGFKQGGAPGGGAGGGGMHGGGGSNGGGGGLYSSSFSSSRQKLTDERVRSLMLAKVMSSMAAKEQQQQQQQLLQQHFAGLDQEYSTAQVHAIPAAAGGGGAGDEGSFHDFYYGAQAAVDGGVLALGGADMALAAGFLGTSADFTQPLARRTSLPQLPNTSYPSDHAPPVGVGGVPSPQGRSHPRSAQGQAAVGWTGPARAPYGRAAVGRSSTLHDNGLPAVQGQAAAAGARSRSFEAARRTVPRP